VVEHDQGTHEYVVCSGTGPQADWYLNLGAHPAEMVQVRNRQWRAAQRFLPAAEAAARFARYERKHPKTATRLLKLMGNSYDGTDSGRADMMTSMPMIAFSDRPMV
jgi:deazaflavin-dependent oxidoreductase (nitroreductase family)